MEGNGLPAFLTNPVRQPIAVDDEGDEAPSRRHARRHARRYGKSLGKRPVRSRVRNSATKPPASPTAMANIGPAAVAAAPGSVRVRARAGILPLKAPRSRRLDASRTKDDVILLPSEMNSEGSVIFGQCQGHFCWSGRCRCRLIKEQARPTKAPSSWLDAQGFQRGSMSTAAWTSSSSRSLLFDVVLLDLVVSLIADVRPTFVLPRKALLRAAQGWGHSNLWLLRTIAGTQSAAGDLRRSRRVGSWWQPSTNPSSTPSRSSRFVRRSDLHSQAGTDVHPVFRLVSRRAR